MHSGLSVVQLVDVAIDANRLSCLIKGAPESRRRQLIPSLPQLLSNSQQYEGVHR